MRLDFPPNFLLENGCDISRIQQPCREIGVATVAAMLERMANPDMLVVRALKNSQLTDGESHVIYGTGH